MNLSIRKPGNPVQVSSCLAVGRNISSTVTWIYDHLLPDGRVERLYG